eukprot:TRINITY_DN6051_c0_g1_i7.p1 TRINITY_DN6051_c0_g1~~TRINITY_DN6051_c0_g1_i7.p1  ORF type:complete len:463 (-),score=63.82 TRINITY_DN6051_c0_g1_i7:659-2047(-)
MTCYVKKRPGVEAFLQRMGELYEVVVFTASISEYASSVIDEIDTARSVAFKLYREGCTVHENAYVKDLDKLGRDLADVIIVDNSQASYRFHPNNALDILSFFDEDDDRELDRHTRFLEFMAFVKDVRSVEEWRKKFESGIPFEYEDVLGHTKTFNLAEFMAQREIPNDLINRKSREVKHNATNPTYYPIGGDPYDSSAGVRSPLKHSANNRGYDSPSTATTPLLPTSIIHSAPNPSNNSRPTTSTGSGGGRLASYPDESPSKLRSSIGYNAAATATQPDLSSNTNNSMGTPINPSPGHLRYSAASAPGGVDGIGYFSGATPTHHRTESRGSTQYLAYSSPTTAAPQLNGQRFSIGAPGVNTYDYYSTGPRTTTTIGYGGTLGSTPTGAGAYTTSPPLYVGGNTDGFGRMSVLSSQAGYGRPTYTTGLGGSIQPSPGGAYIGSSGMYANNPGYESVAARPSYR